MYQQNSSDNVKNSTFPLLKGALLSSPTPFQFSINKKELKSPCERIALTEKPLVKASTMAYDTDATTKSDQTSIEKGNESHDVFADLNENDVVFKGGRTPSSIATSGNPRFKELILQKSHEYKIAASRMEKDHIVNSIIQRIRQSDPPGRFLRLDENNDNGAEKESELVCAGQSYARIRVAEHLKAESLKGTLQLFGLTYGHSGGVSLRRCSSKPSRAKASSYSLDRKPKAVKRKSIANWREHWIMASADIARGGL